MRKFVAFTVVGSAIIWMAWAGWRMAGPGSAEAMVNLGVQPQGLGMKFAGGWLCDLYLGGSPTATPLLMTVTADGTFTVNGSPLPGGATVSTAHGSWKAVGQNAMAGNLISIGYNPDATPGWYEKGPMNCTLTDNGNRLEGTLTIGLYSIDQDPLGDEDPANGVVPCTMIGRRIKAQ
jgi:hypothetical protein